MSRDVDAVAVCALGPAPLLVDASLEPLTPALLFSLDRRAESERERLGTTHDHALPKLLWWREHEPSLWRRAAWALDLTGFLVTRLTGVPVQDAITHADYAHPAEEFPLPVPEPLEPLAHAGGLGSPRRPRARSAHRNAGDRRNVRHLRRHRRRGCERAGRCLCPARLHACHRPGGRGAGGVPRVGGLALSRATGSSSEDGRRPQASLWTGSERSSAASKTCTRWTQARRACSRFLTSPASARPSGIRTPAAPSWG